MNNWRDVIKRWESCGQLADDLGIEPWAVHKWHERNRVPAKHWGPLIEAGRKRGIKLNANDLVRIDTNARLAEHGSRAHG